MSVPGEDPPIGPGEDPRTKFCAGAGAHAPDRPNERVCRSCGVFRESERSTKTAGRLVHCASQGWQNQESLIVIESWM